MGQHCTWMTAPHYRHSVVQGESFQCAVGFTILQHHVEVALLVLGLRTCQSQLGHLICVLFLVLHNHFITEAFWSRVITNVHGVVVHAGHYKAPLHKLHIREVFWVVGCDEVCV